MAFVLPEPSANVYSIPDKKCSLNDLPDADEMAPACASLRLEGEATLDPISPATQQSLNPIIQ
jgi:hypothetical protein